MVSVEALAARSVSPTPAGDSCPYPVLARLTDPTSPWDGQPGRNSDSSLDDRSSRSGMVSRVVAKVLTLGDVHGNIPFLRAACEAASAAGCSTVLQLGDLGAFWPRSDRFLADIDEICEFHGIDQIVFIDGNHEGFTSQVTFVAADGTVTSGGLVAALAQAARDDDGFVVLSKRVRWAPRGHRWTWAGRRFGALGGAFSVDWRRRSNYVTWWRDEELTCDEDVAALGAGPLDVLVTHDAPAGVDMTRFSMFDLPVRDLVIADGVRDRLAQAIQATLPELVVHGHWHARHSSVLSWVDRPATETSGDLVWRSARVEGFGADVSDVWPRESWAVLDVASLELLDTNPPSC